jgi:hypothetical protein
MIITVDESVTDEIIASEYTEIYTTGAMRSGNSWIGRLLSDLLNCPWQDHSGVAMAFYGIDSTGKFVIRKRHSVDKLPGLTVFVYRDPRDVCVSKRFYDGLSDMSKTIGQMRSPTVDDPGGFGPYEIFVRLLWEHPEKYTTRLRYEDLHETPIITLRRIVEALVGTSLTDDYISESYERQTFGAFLGRYPQALGSMRKGIMGDWKNHFNREDGRVFQEYFGQLMLDQGYIESDFWWEELPI